MKPTTREQFIQIIDDDLAWRKMELSVLRDSLEKARGGVGEKTAVRAMVVLLYAHWEGFVRSSCQAYAHYLALRRFADSDLDPDVIAGGLWVRHRAVPSLEDWQQIVRRLVVEGSRSHSAQWKKYGDTKSNLSYEVYRDVTKSLGLSVKGMDLRRHLINERLLAKRNRVAHGEFLDENTDSTAELAERVLEMMQWIQNEVQNAVFLEAYRRVG